MLPAGTFHPFALDSFGLGEVIRAASAKGARRCILGLGGSATNDGGFGLASALGWEFLDREGKLNEQWTGLRELSVIRAPEHQYWLDKLIVAVDVKNQLLGAHGATRLYGPQKGLCPFELKAADHCLRRLADIFRKDFGRDYRRTFGSGAAGGLGSGPAGGIQRQFLGLLNQRVEHLGDLRPSRLLTVVDLAQIKQPPLHSPALRTHLLGNAPFGLLEHFPVLGKLPRVNDQFILLYIMIAAPGS